MPVPDADMLPKDRASGLIFAIERHSVIKSARQDINAARAYSGSVRASYYPKLSLELAANADNNLAGEDGLDLSGTDMGGHRNDLSLMVRMQYNLYSGW